MPVDVTLAVLAGGRGSRMGVTKDRLVIGGRPALVHLLDRVAHRGPTMLVAAADRPALPIGHERFDRVVTDLVPGAGPLAGLAAAAAAAARTPVVLALSIDMPNVGPDQVRWLHDALIARPAAAGLLCDRGPDDDGQTPAADSAAAPARHGRGGVEPFPCAVRAAAAGPVLAAELAAGRRALHSLLDLPGFEAARTPAAWPGSVWLNLNRPEDLALIGASIA